MTSKAHILLQNYVDAVWDYRLERDSGKDPVAEEEKMDQAEAELTQYITGIEQLAEKALRAAAEEAKSLALIRAFEENNPG